MKRAILLGALSLLFACSTNSPTEPDLASKKQPQPRNAVNGISLSPSSVASHVGDVDTVIGTATKNGAVCLSCNITYTILGADTLRAKLVATFVPAGGTGRRGAVVQSLAEGSARLQGGNNGYRDTTLFTITAAPDTTPPDSIQGVTIAPGDNWQAKVDANPDHTVFHILAGTHLSQKVLAKQGDQFIGDAGAVMDGQGTMDYAFASSGGNPDSVTIRGLRVTNYNPPLQRAMIDGAGAGLTDGWVVEGNEIDHSGNVGLLIGTHAIARNNHIHHNARLGIGGGGTGSIVDSNEVDFNHLPGVSDPVGEVGGSKFVGTTNLLVRDNYFHDNLGDGIWFDIDNIGYVVESNRSEDNAGDGIEVEISYQGVVRNNTVKRNGFGGATWLIGVRGIGIDASPDVEVYGNIVEANNVGIAAVQQSRGTGAYGPRVIKNLYVHDNQIVRSSGVEFGGAQAVLAADNGEPLNDPSYNNQFRNNVYVGNCGNPRWTFNSGWKTFAQWQSLGQDVGGSCTL